MNDEKEFEPIRRLLGGTVTRPSPRFEQSLLEIPDRRAAPSTTVLTATLRVVAMAAACLALVWAGLIPEVIPTAGTGTAMLEDDPQLLVAFALADALDPASSLLVDDHLLAIDYLTSIP